MNKEGRQSRLHSYTQTLHWSLFGQRLGHLKNECAAPASSLFAQVSTNSITGDQAREENEGSLIKTDCNYVLFTSTLPLLSFQSISLQFFSVFTLR